MPASLGRDVELGEDGSDKSGLLCGYHFLPGGSGRPIDADEASAILAMPATERIGEFLWLHFNLANLASQRWLRQQPLPDAFHTSLDHVQSTRVELAGTSVVAVLNDVAVFDLDARTSRRLRSAFRNIWW